jgi:hypothetical protein
MCIVLPFVLGTLLAQASPLASDNNNTMTRRLEVLVMAMKICDRQYEDISQLCEVVTKMLSRQLPIDARKSSGFEWSDIIARQPTFYSHAALTIDMAISKGRLPFDSEVTNQIGGGLSSLDPSLASRSL